MTLGSGRPPVVPETLPAPAVLSIDLTAIAANWRQLSAIAGHASAAVVKADAYGLGVDPVARTLLQAGCRDFFVSQADEGRALRVLCEAVGQDAAIYVLNGIDDADLGFHRAFRLRPVLSSPQDVAAWLASGEAGPLAALHFDTGISRLGLSDAEAASVAASLRHRMADIRLVMSHFVASEERDNRINADQIGRFESLRAQFGSVPASLANSSGVFLPARPHYDLIRPGYALYGGNPTPGRANPMRPVLGLSARVIQLRTVAPGATVGYAGTWTARQQARLAIVSLGYADGLPRLAGASDERAGAEAMVGGIRCPIVGRVSMDLAAVDVSEVADAAAVQPGATIAFLNKQIGIDDLAAGAQTIGYAIMTGFGRRPRRQYRQADG